MARPDASIEIPAFASEAIGRCYGCGPDNPEGLHLHARREGALTVVDWQPRPEHAGWDTVVHGGFVALFVDEVAAFAMFGQERIFGMTRNLQVQYKRRTLWTKPVRGEAAVESRDAQRAVVKARLLQDGQVTAEGTVEFALMPQGPPPRA